MPRLTIRQHGASASIPRHPIAGNLQKPEERKANRGWTAPWQEETASTSNGLISRELMGHRTR